MWLAGTGFGWILAGLLGLLVGVMTFDRAIREVLRARGDTRACLRLEAETPTFFHGRCSPSFIDFER